AKKQSILTEKRNKSNSPLDSDKRKKTDSRDARILFKTNQKITTKEKREDSSYNKENKYTEQLRLNVGSVKKEYFENSDEAYSKKEEKIKIRQESAMRSHRKRKKTLRNLKGFS
ncbi:7039_t:CDS:2, partial [Gigaspora rosea]